MIVIDCDFCCNINSGLTSDKLYELMRAIDIPLGSKTYLLIPRDLKLDISLNLILTLKDFGIELKSFGIANQYIEHGKNIIYLHLVDEKENRLARIECYKYITS